MINFSFLEKNKEELKTLYYQNKPFPHLVIKDICDINKIEKLYSQIPDLDNKSRDYNNNR